MSTYTCPVCLFPDLSEQPWSEAGPSYEICPSCGFEFGVTDDDLGTTPQSWREAWVAGGARWASASPPPPGWDGLQQLRGR